MSIDGINEGLTKGPVGVTPGELSPVRTLARRFADGALERRAYITERRRLIDAIAAGDVEWPERASAASRVAPPAAGCTLDEDDDTVELPKPGPLPASAPAGVHVLQPSLHRTPMTAGGWWLVASLMLSLAGVATWLWLELAPLRW